MTQNEFKYAFDRHRQISLRQTMYSYFKPMIDLSNWRMFCLLSNVVYNATKNLRKDRL